MLANMLDAPVAELPVGNNVNVGEDLLDAGSLHHDALVLHTSSIAVQGTYLVFLEAVFEDVLDDQAARLAKGNLVPHATQSLVDILHDLRRGVGPAKLKELLPDMARIAVNHSFRNPSQKLMDHYRLVLLWNGVKCLLDHVAAEGVHRKTESIASDGLRNFDNLLRRAMLKAALDEEVSEAIDHQWIGLGDDCFDNVILLLRRANLQLLLEEDGCLLVIVADDLVDNVLPVAVDIAVKKATIVQRLGSG